MYLKFVCSNSFGKRIQWRDIDRVDQECRVCLVWFWFAMTRRQTKNAIYMIPCRDCPQRYIGQTSKKIETQITEHKNAIKRHDHLSLPAAHTYDNCHTFNWTETQLLGPAQTKHAREFKEAWYSIDANTINKHIEIPTIYLQLKTIRKYPTNKNNTMANDINFQ